MEYKRFSFPKKKYFVTSTKSFIKLNENIEKWKEYIKIQELFDICRDITEKIDDGIHLKEMKYITDTLGGKEEEKILKAVKTKRKYHTIE